MPPPSESPSPLGSFSTCQAAGTGSEAASSYVNASWIPRASRIFDALSVDEVESVQSFVEQQLGLATSAKGYPNSTSDFVFRILLEEPEKQAALRWLDASANGEETAEDAQRIDALVASGEAAAAEEDAGQRGETEAQAETGSVPSSSASSSPSSASSLVLPPPRYAHVIIFRGNPSQRDMMEYRVGPLPLLPATATLTQRRRDGEVPFSKHPIDGVSGQWTATSVLRDAQVLAPIFKDITGGHCYGVGEADDASAAGAANAREGATFSNGTSAADATPQAEGGDGDAPSDGAPSPAAAPAAAPSPEPSLAPSAPLDADRTYTSLPPVINRFAPAGGYECDMDYIVFLEYPVVQDDRLQRVAVIKWQFQPDGWGDEAGYLFPLPLSWKVNETAENSNDWESFDYEYCHQGPFASAEALLEAFGNGTLRRCANTDLGDPDYDASWARTDRNYARDTQVLDDEDGGYQMDDSNQNAAQATGADGTTSGNVAGWSSSGDAGATGGSDAPAGAPAPESSRSFPDRTFSDDGGVTAIRPKPASRSFAPQGYRFELSSLSGAGRAVRGLGWTAHVSLRPDTGLVLHDVRFRNERIVYELAQQDMFVAYSGYGGAGQTIYMDSVYGIGINTRPLKRGYDCPWGAAYLDSELSYGFFGAAAQHDVLCVFEHDPQMPAWRHTHVTDARGAHADGARGAHLAVRSIATIGNYDYIFTVHLEQDGSIDVSCTMAGYMSALFSDPLGATWRDAPFGTRVHSHTLAHLHDHMSGWKVDLDVLGTNNTFLLSTARAGTYAEALASLQRQADAGGGDAALADASVDGPSPAASPAASPSPASSSPSPSPSSSAASSFSTSASTPLSQVPPEWVGNDLPLKYIDRSNSPTTEAAFRYNLSAPQIYRFASSTDLNSFGEPRSYVIVPRTATLGLLPASHPLMKAAAWTKYSVAVTKRHDSELTSHASMYDFYNPGFPIVSLDDYIDGESVVDQDLVAWVSVGALHVPRSEDVPLIQNFGVGFSIKPWNYFDHLASLEAERYDKLNWDVCAPNEFGQNEYTWALY